jgi:hypothetical protein
MVRQRVKSEKIEKPEHTLENYPAVSENWQMLQKRHFSDL